MKRAEQVLGLVLLLFAVYIGYESSLIEAGAEFGMGPGFMPFWLSVGLGITAAALLFRAVALPASRFATAFYPEKAGALRVILVLAGYLLAIVLMKPLGMPISLAILTAITVPVFGSRNWKTIALTAVLTLFGVYLVFGRWLGVPLPMGILEEVLPIYGPIY
ncbi:MAG: tripartite tricarboxylate transporter TctB family protein [Deltaproteobacteria bacterium]|nr:tripartite tricarboxylate transporter TctB family protein [Deltaproteobacteria bacterium]MDA8126508.1 tripartite tricarboxylate transporter TctB family protein [Deltaproteobacteria bacterium]